MDEGEKKFGGSGEERKFKLDLRGFECPLNIIRAKSFIKDVPPGSIVDIIVDYPTAFEDVPRALEKEGHKVLRKQKITDRDFLITVQKKI